MDHLLMMSVCLQIHVSHKRNTKLFPVFCNNQFRLTNGSTNREGRVEVCMDGRWGTVCNNSQEGIAGAVCSQLGFPAEGLSHKHIFIAIV